MVGKNLGTVAVIPASNAVPLHNFTFEFGLAINDIGNLSFLGWYTKKGGYVNELAIDWFLWYEETNQLQDR